MLYEDIGLGTFRDDASLAFLANLIVAFLLLAPERAHIIRRRALTAVWLSLTVLVTRSEISKIALVVIWGAYLTAHLRVRTVVYTAVAAAILSSVAYLSGAWDLLMVNAVKQVQSEMATSYDPSRYLTGEYSRAAAIMYHLNRDVLWFGDGPGRYHDPITHERLRGNTGQHLKYYSEVGLIGCVFGALFFYFAGRQTPDKRMLWFSLVTFVVSQLMGVTIELLGHLSIVFSYSIMAHGHLIAPQSSADLAGERSS